MILTSYSFHWNLWVSSLHFEGSHLSNKWKNLLLGEERKWGLIKKILLDFSDRRWLSQTTLWQVKCKWIRTYGLNFLSSIRGSVNHEKKGMKKCSLILPNPRHLNNCSRKYAKATFFSLKPTTIRRNTELVQSSVSDESLRGLWNSPMIPSELSFRKKFRFVWLLEKL